MISKKVMNKAIELEKEFKIKDIMCYQMLLEMHNGSLENFMCNIDIKKVLEEAGITRLVPIRETMSGKTFW